MGNGYARDHESEHGHDHESGHEHGCEHRRVHEHEHGSTHVHDHVHERAHAHDHDHERARDHERAHAHDHVHEHAHDPDVHDHGHEHSHDHTHSHAESAEFSWADAKFEVHTHEQAATVSMDLRPHGGCGKGFSDLVAVMQGIARAAESAGGIVGHIKAFVKQGDSSARASVTAAELPPTCDGDQSMSFGDRTDIQLVAIVLLVSETELLEICKEALVL